MRNILGIPSFLGKTDGVRFKNAICDLSNPAAVYTMPLSGTTASVLLLYAILSLMKASPVPRSLKVSKEKPVTDAGVENSA